jgi:hypothetical protein
MKIDYICKFLKLGTGEGSILVLIIVVESIAADLTIPKLRIANKNLVGLLIKRVNTVGN